VSALGNGDAETKGVFARVSNKLANRAGFGAFRITPSSRSCLPLQFWPADARAWLWRQCGCC